MMSKAILASSFRDPSGFLFKRDGVLYRQVNRIYRENYDLLMSNGLYDRLVQAGLMIGHHEVNIIPEVPETAYKVIKTDLVPFISYPYEWCFSQLKDAALTTLEIQRMAIDAGMCLKDGSAYNIQFVQGCPILIDTLSFTRYEEGAPWVAYKQFCQHFIAPLTLMSYTDIRLNQLLRIHIDGVPLDLASRLLSFRTKIVPGLLTHIHIHAKFQTRYADKQVKVAHTGRKMSRMAILGLIDNLKSVCKHLRYTPGPTEWGDYYEATNYTQDAQKHKANCVAEFVKSCAPRIVWDLGANTGYFTRIAVQEKGTLGIAFDVDPVAVEKNYLECRREKVRLLPLVMDLTNPTNGIGWQAKERMSIMERGPADMVLALALIHHLAISNNIPFGNIAEFFKEISRTLVIEFVPKNDSQVQRLLSTREDIFTEYTQESFERAFEKLFIIERRVQIKSSQRTLYLLRNKVVVK